MSPTKTIKSIVLLGALVCAATLLGPNKSCKLSHQTVQTPTPAIANLQDPGYVGSEACKDCHEDQFKAFSHTSHSELTKISGWKNKVTGCEACHGPGKAHIEEGDPTKIISFKGKTSKETSEICLNVSRRKGRAQQLHPW